MFLKFNKNLYNKMLLIENYRNIREIPVISNIVLHFGLKNVSQNSKIILSGLLALNIISKQKSVITYSTKSVMLLKIKNGQAVGCKINLNKVNSYNFIITYIILFINKKYNISNNKITNKSITIKIDKLFYFKKLEYFYENFEELPFLSISINTNKINSKNLYALLKII